MTAMGVEALGDKKVALLEEKGHSELSSSAQSSARSKRSGASSGGLLGGSGSSFSLQPGPESLFRLSSTSASGNTGSSSVPPTLPVSPASALPSLPSLQQLKQIFSAKARDSAAQLNSVSSTNDGVLGTAAKVSSASKARTRASSGGYASRVLDNLLYAKDVLAKVGLG